MINVAKLTVERMDRVEAAEALKARWNDLLEDNAARTIELTYEWQLTYWKHFNDHAELFILVAREGDTVVGIAPLKLTHTWKFGVPIRVLEFIAGQESNYQDFIIAQEHHEAVLEAMLDYLVDHRSSWDTMYLIHIPDVSPTLRVFDALNRPALLYRVDQTKQSIYLNVDKTWEAYVADTEDARSKVTYRTRKLHRQGEVHYFHCEDEEQFAANLEKFFAVHRQRWNSTATPSEFNHKRNRQFYLDIIPQLLPKKQVDLFCIEVDGNPAAYVYSFWFGQHSRPRSMLVQLLVYSDDYHRASPSLVAFDLMLEEIFAAGEIDIVDFGDYFPFKELWADTLKSKVNVQICTKKPHTCYVYALSRFDRFAREQLKKNPHLVRLVRAVEGWQRHRKMHEDED